MLQAILFDLGDTLLDIEPLDTRAVYDAGARLTYHRLADMGVNLPAFARYSKRYYRRMWAAYLWAKVRRKDFDAETLLGRYHRRMGLPTGAEILREMSWLWYRPFTEHMTPEEGLAGTLAALRRAGLRLGIVSNTFIPGFAHDRQLEELGLLEFFPVRVYSSATGWRKPDLRIFRHAMELMNVPAQTALFVGDLVKTDIIGAKRAGMKTALKQPWANLRVHRIADYLIRRVADLLTDVPEIAERIRPADPAPTAPALHG